MAFRTHAFAALAASVALAGAANALPTPVYLMKAGAGDLYEKRSSEIVLQSTHDAGIRDFANMMISDHATSTAMVKSAAMRAHMTAKPPMLSPKQKSMIADLMAAHGPARDRIYVDQQKMAHQEALDVQKDYAMSGDKPPLRAAAAKIVPVVEHHISMLQSMPAM